MHMLFEGYFGHTEHFDDGKILILTAPDVRDLAGRFGDDRLAFMDPIGPQIRDGPQKPHLEQRLSAVDPILPIVPIQKRL